LSARRRDGLNRLARAMHEVSAWPSHLLRAEQRVPSPKRSASRMIAATSWPL